jgi:hypothetical protein
MDALEDHKRRNVTLQEFSNSGLSLIFCVFSSTLIVLCVGYVLQRRKIRKLQSSSECAYFSIPSKWGFLTENLAFSMYAILLVNGTLLLMLHGFTSKTGLYAPLWFEAAILACCWVPFLFSLLPRD